MNPAANQETKTSVRKNLPIGIVDDEPDMVETMVGNLEKLGFPVSGTTDPEEALEQIRGGQYRVALVDMKMPAMDGMAFLEKTLQSDPGVYVILMTGFYSLDSAVEAVKHGAYDYLAKPIDRERLVKTLDELAEEFTRRRQIQELEDRLLPNVEFHGLVGKSPAMIEVFEQVQKIAKHYTNVLISGPTGSGKELVAKALHQLSPIAQQRLAICNCSALVDTLLESQLFGHVRGAFTGATDTRAGLFEYANGGAVFLDEVSEMSLPMQAKLLRVIQNREIQRVGSPEVKRVDVRLIAATNRDIRAEVLAGRFREDLFYRLSTLEIRVPSLAERRDDIPVLVQYFVKKYSQAYGKTILGLSRRSQTVMVQHSWPGNVREVENVISAACINTVSNFIDVSDLPPHLQRPMGRVVRGDEAWRPLPLAEIRRIHIERVLEMCGGSRVRAAQILGIGRTSLYRHLKHEHKKGIGRTTAA